VAGAKLAQQHVEALGFGNEDGGPQQAAQVELAPGEVAQQILGQQDADDVVLAAADHRKARMPGVDDEAGNILDRAVEAHAVHLRARHHDVVSLHVGNLQRTFDDRQGVGVEQVALESGLQQGEKVVAVFRLTRQQRGDALDE